MRYFAERDPDATQYYGQTIKLNTFIAEEGTIYRSGDIGIIVLQKFFDSTAKVAYFGPLEPDIANAVYLSKNFVEFFNANATEHFPIYTLRKLMWELRMKPLPLDDWERIFKE